MIETLDPALAFLPVWARISLWALVCSALSMWLYRQLSPQAALKALKEAQGASRKRLRGYDGDMAGLYRLIGTDLKISLRQMKLILLPTLVAVAPVVYVMLVLADFYTGENAEWIFLGTMLPASLAIKYMFRIH